MEFMASPEQEILRKSVREFAEKVLGPGVADRDEKDYYDPATFKAMAEMGLTGMPLDECWGGAGMDLLSYTMAIEEISRVDPSAGDTLAVHVSLCALPILSYGSEAQKSKYLNLLATGQIQGAFAVTEPDAGSDTLGISTRAALEGGEWVLNGRKIFITNAAAADLYLVAARTGSRDLGGKALSIFVVEKGTPGLSFGKYEKKMGLRGTQICDVIMEDCRIPVENLLGEAGQGFAIAMDSLNGGRIGIAAQAVGIAQGAYEKALDYAKNRMQFGKPVVKFQSLAFKLADMAVEIEASRLLTYQAAWKKQNALPFAVYASMAKLKAAQTAMWAANQAVQIHGGYGYTRAYQVERMMRDAKITEIYQGTNEIQKLIISMTLFSLLPEQTPSVVYSG